MAAIKYEIISLSYGDLKLGLQIGDVVIKATKQKNSTYNVCCMLPNRLKGKGHSGPFKYGEANYWYFSRNQLKVVSHDYVG